MAAIEDRLRDTLDAIEREDLEAADFILEEIRERLTRESPGSPLLAAEDAIALADDALGDDLLELAEDHLEQALRIVGQAVSA